MVGFGRLKVVPGQITYAGRFHLPDMLEKDSLDTRVIYIALDHWKEDRGTAVRAVAVSGSGDGHGGSPGSRQERDKLWQWSHRPSFRICRMRTETGEFALVLAGTYPQTSAVLWLNMKGRPSLPLDGRRRLAADVVDHTRHTLHFIHNPP